MGEGVATPKSEENLTDEGLMALYREMVLTRTFEEAVQRLNVQKGIPETAHLCIGQEAIGAGACRALRPDDYVVPALRDRGVFLSRGVTPSVLMAGVLGKATGPAKGKWPAHHMGDLEKGILAASLVIGSQFPIAAGAGLAIKYKNTDQVVVCFFGDGASNRGDFHEGVNLAAILSLPVIFLCENNLYAIDTPVSKSMLVRDVAVRAQGYGIPGTTIDGNDVLAVYSAVRQAVARAREGGGPSLVEGRTYRLRPHTERLKEDRPSGEIAYWTERCPIRRFRDALLARGVLNEHLDQEIVAECEAVLIEAIKFAEQSPYPPVEELFEDVYADGVIREGRLCAR